MSTRVLEGIREELKEIKLLYKELVEKLVPVEEAKFHSSGINRFYSNAIL